MTEDKNSLTENTSNTSSGTASNPYGIYVEHVDSKTTKWVGFIDFPLLSEQRDELVVINRKEQSENIEGLIEFLDILIDSYLGVKATY